MCRGQRLILGHSPPYLFLFIYLLFVCVCGVLRQDLLLTNWETAKHTILATLSGQQVLGIHFCMLGLDTSVAMPDCSHGAENSG